METAKILGYDLQHIDRFVNTWNTLITAANDILDSFHGALNGTSQGYIPLSFWHFFFSKVMELYRAFQSVILSRYELKSHQMINTDTGDDAGNTLVDHE